MKHYRGKPFHDSVYRGGPQKIPGRIQCAYYDFGGGASPWPGKNNWLTGSL